MRQIIKKTNCSQEIAYSFWLGLIALLFLLSAHAQAMSEGEALNPKNYDIYKKETVQEKAGLDNPDASRRTPEYIYGYKNRAHTMKENLRHIGGIYLASWVLYPLSQPKVFREDGSFEKYGNNFGKLVFDKDEPFWNWFVHPISGSQLFLYYRANGYSRIHSLAMAFVSSTLFEFTIEIYTEPASVQDLYQTPIIGSVLGVGLENLSMYLLNTGNVAGKFFGHLLNPSTLLWFYEGKVKFIPDYREYQDGEKRTSASVIFTF